MRIILIRHGETTWNIEGRYQGQEDTPLSERGRKQGLLLAEALREIPIDLCISSPLQRSYQTCRFCADLHGLPVATDERLTEINHGESLEDVRRRARAAFDEYAAKYEGKTVLVAAHDAVNKAIICDLLGLDMSHFWQIKQDNTCVNVLEYTGGTWRVVLLNSTQHLGFLFSGIEQAGL